jgi:energy-coupling factor transporter ATP-binding protein EcfA2
MVQKIFETIRTIAATGVTTLLVEQNAKLALELCDRGYVMERADHVDRPRAALLANRGCGVRIWGVSELMNKSEALTPRCSASARRRSPERWHFYTTRPRRST